LHILRPMDRGSRAWERTGYVVAVDAVALIDLATAHHTVLRVLPQAGDFIVAGMALLEVAPAGDSPHQGWRRAIAPCFMVQGERSVHQDAAYGLQQLVDVALRAVSPSMQDPTTVVSCVDHLGALLHRLFGRHAGHARRALRPRSHLCDQCRSAE